MSPGRAGVAGSVRRRPGNSRYTKVTRLHAVSRRSRDQDDHADRERHGARQHRRPTARAASATPSGEAAIETPSTRRSNPHPRAGQPTRCVSPSTRTARGSAAASGPETAASSPPSSPSTFQGTSLQRRATTDRASASMPSTSSSRRASAYRRSPTSTRTRRQSPPRWWQRAAPRRRRRRRSEDCAEAMVDEIPIPPQSSRPLKCRNFIASPERGPNRFASDSRTSVERAVTPPGPARAGACARRRLRWHGHRGGIRPSRANRSARREGDSR